MTRTTDLRRGRTNRIQQPTPSFPTTPYFLPYTQQKVKGNIFAIFNTLFGVVQYLCYMYKYINLIAETSILKL